MATNEEYKKAQRKTEENLEPRLNRHGKQPHQRMKPYLVLDYLMRQTDQAHFASAYDISEYLAYNFGINADRRSIYDDIKEINKILYLQDNPDDFCSIEDVDKLFEEAEKNGELEDLQTIAYDKKNKGFYIRQRKFDLTDIQFLAQCVYSARFLSKGQCDRLADAITEFVSDYQRDEIKYDTFLTDRIRTANKQVLINISNINEAMRKGTKDAPHMPHKISFKYLKYSINDISKQAERRQGQSYVVSPYKLLINEGNYYLIAYSDKFQEIRTYRLDRMKDVTELEGVEREGENDFLKMDLSMLSSSTFGMFDGEYKGVTLRFVSKLLDSVIDRLGTKNVTYSKADNNHFYVEAHVAISDQFFGWLLGFGNMVKIMGPDSIIEEFRDYLDKIRCMY